MSNVDDTKKRGTHRSGGGLQIREGHEDLHLHFALHALRGSSHQRRGSIHQWRGSTHHQRGSTHQRRGFIDQV
eukprot:822969-Pyramimonas_sp.AAC.1